MSITIETRELAISKELKKKVDMICRFTCREYGFINGGVVNVKNINIAYAKPHILKVNNKDY